MTKISPKTVCRAEDGQPVHEITLGPIGGLTATVLTWGATLSGLSVPDRSGHADNIVLAFARPEGFLANGPYFGATCGRYANRIAKGQFQIGESTYQLPLNNGPNHLHGGLTGLTRRHWELVSAEATSDCHSANLRVVSPDGEEGYPGNLEVVVEYHLRGSGELAIRYSASSDQPTCINLTNHAYWNLGGQSAESRAILDHTLSLDCDRFVPVDDVQIPTGELLLVDGTPMDFRSEKAIGTDIGDVDGGYDHCYVISASDGSASDGELRRAATVCDPRSGRTMEVLTTEPGIQLYTGNFLDGSEECGGFSAREGFCLECQHFPDSPNQSSFPSTLLAPGETYLQETVHRFGIRN